MAIIIIKVALLTVSMVAGYRVMEIIADEYAGNKNMHN